MKTFVLTAIVGVTLAGAAGAAPPASVTLAATPALVSYGTPVTASGQLSTQRSNQAIVIQATECGTTKQVKATTLKTAANGAYTGPVTPTVTTVYQATYKTVKSAPVSIARMRLIRPRGDEVSTPVRP